MKLTTVGIIFFLRSLSGFSFLSVLEITSKSFVKVFQKSLKPMTFFIYGKHFFTLFGNSPHSSGKFWHVVSAILSMLDAA